MELRAVVEPLHLLPSSIRFWVSTDSSYVKKGITEWIHDWNSNGSRNAKGAHIADFPCASVFISLAATPIQDEIPVA
jgi:ribonuclease HI